MRGGRLRLSRDLQPRRIAATIFIMTENDLLQEIHRVREKVAAECDFDVHKIGERMRQREREERARGVVYVEPTHSAVVREDSPPN